MTNAQENQTTARTNRPVLVFLAAGLCAILASSVLYRMKDNEKASAPVISPAVSAVSSASSDASSGAPSPSAGTAPALPADLAQAGIPANAPPEMLAAMQAAAQKAAQGTAAQGSTPISSGASQPAVSLPEDAANALRQSGQMPAEIPQAMRDAMLAQGMNIPEGVKIRDAGANPATPSASASGANSASPAASSSSSAAPADSNTASAAPSAPQAPSTLRPVLQAPENPHIAHLKARLAEQPHDVDVIIELADLLIREKRTEEAADQLNHALVAAPADARPSYYLGILNANRGQYAEAADLLERSLRLQDSPDARYSLAILYRYHLNKPDLAQQNLQTAQSLPTEDQELKKMIAQELQK